MLNNKILTLMAVLSCFISTVAYSFGDPTKPPANAQIYTIDVEKKTNEESTKYVLNAIKINSNNRSAIINGEKYVIGQKLGAARVKSISLNNVLLTSGKVLSLFDNKSNQVMKKGY